MKSCGKHPTQKPLALLSRIILASTQPNTWILDPFAGSSTTGIAANLLGRRYLGIEKEKSFVEMSKARKLEIESLEVFDEYKSKIHDIARLEKVEKKPFPSIASEPFPTDYLPFIE